MINNNFKDSKCHIYKGAPPIENFQSPPTSLKSRQLILVTALKSTA